MAKSAPNGNNKQPTTSSNRDGAAGRPSPRRRSSSSRNEKNGETRPPRSSVGKNKQPATARDRDDATDGPSLRWRCSSSRTKEDGDTRPPRSHNTMHSKKSPRPSTWPLFLIHFVLPMALLLLVSNSDGIYGGFGSLPSQHPTPPLLVSEESAKPSSLPTGSSSNPKYQFQSEIDAVIERKQKQKATASASRQRNSNAADNSNIRPKKTGAGLQSSPIYLQMEAKIKTLRAKYEESQGLLQEYLEAVRYADFLKYRDTSIHDGGTYQMEAIDVYSHAIELLEDMWRDKMVKGEEVRLPVTPSAGDSGYTGLNRELFMDYESKSMEAMLCSTYSNLGKMYFMSNMFQRAVDSYEECLSYDHDYLDALTSRALALVILGKYDEAGRDYKHVLETDTDRLFLDAVTGLAKVLTAKEDAVTGGWDFLVNMLETEMPQQKQAYERMKLSKNAGVVKHYADGLKRMHLAMFAYHDVKTKNSSEAWKHLTKGNYYKLSTVGPFDAATEKERVSRAKQVFTRDFFPKGIGSQTRTPIFIIGFVRSGSTLLERILDAHPLIVGTGEDSVFNGRLDTIRNEIVKASMNTDVRVLHDKVKELADDVVADMKTRWEVIDANVHADDEEEDKNSKEERPYPLRFADKMLTNYMNVGFIHLLFPNALILHVAREPMDSIFSAFKHDFPGPGNLDYTSEFKGLAQLYQSYRDIMEHWDTVLPGRVTHIRYEDMVTDLPNIAPKIIEAAGVKWDPTVLEFHKKKHAVNTLSTTQVRKGLYSHHFKGWKRYEEFLEPLVDLVGSRAKYHKTTSLPGYLKTDTKPNSMQSSLPAPRVNVGY
eukprot:CAMPEP_0172321692 /NCGR_PEP_ID=MMETSP1058-20130122/44050_1 /TAXON_ID=83371 /ORGANISM="Detonula confervacea, Strain CCMP 353" /LENGTH=822 /DNA_ID=CAMNT_0013037273 /DNA_START=14 /DNA_END=2482 /DNA_ORIENTATION=+